jgi:UDP-N-acetylglucosamine diphosphorylase / glucose-1-phosphate thymidylyltransferase / UDP-N-acetylgalactosamine diphosphorylase / glucosamine-1-phosphate N-acetyltransferase / galactosamine-1-phosphate N-acetyltransferase
MDHTEIYTAALLDLSGTIATPILPPDDYPWLALPRIADFLAALLAEPPAGYRLAAPGVLVGEGCSLSAHAELRGPAIIGPGTELRTGAYVRENVIIGARCVIGNSTELKNCILFDEVQVPHFNYVGDSILGRRAHLGAGAILSNVKSDGSEVAVRLPDGVAVRTGLAKFGAILGDGVEIGCNAVCNPGSVVGRLARVYPLASLRGFLPGAMIFKANGERVAREDVAGGNRL